MYASLLNFTKDSHKSGSLGAAVNVGPVMCISAPLTARAATRQNTEHTCMNHSLGAAVNVGPVGQSFVSQHP